MQAAVAIPALVPPVSMILMDQLILEVIRMGEASIEKKDDLYPKIEQMGFRVGVALFECITVKCPRFKDPLDMVKFICKDFWMVAFRKNIDNLRTNHKRTFVLQDNAFPLFSHIARGSQYLNQTQILLAFPCGLIAGGLSALGVKADVKAETTQLPSCKFNIEIKTAA